MVKKKRQKIARRVAALRSRLDSINDLVRRESRKRLPDTALLQTLKKTRLNLKDEISSVG